MDSHRTAARARQLKDAGVEIFTVSLDSGDVDGDELYRIASSSYHRYVYKMGTNLNKVSRRRKKFRRKTTSREQ